MTFWKKKEDPWDLDPEQRRRKREREEEPGLLESLRDWGEARKAEKAAEKKMEEEVPPQMCPWCGKEMKRGYLDAVKGGDIWWLTKKPGFKNDLLGPDPNTSLLISDEGGVIYTYKTAWYCKSCEKMTLDAAGALPPYTSKFSLDMEEQNWASEQGAKDDNDL